jgi:hypothetical protein
VLPGVYFQPGLELEVSGLSSTAGALTPGHLENGSMWRALDGFGSAQMMAAGVFSKARLPPRLLKRAETGLPRAGSVATAARGTAGLPVGG